MNWQTFTLCACCLAMVAFGAFGPHCVEVNGYCEPTECPVERCTPEECADIENAVCERTVHASAVSLSYCHLERTR